MNKKLYFGFLTILLGMISCQKEMQFNDYPPIDPEFSDYPDWDSDDLRPFCADVEVSADISGWQDNGTITVTFCNIGTVRVYQPSYMVHVNYFTPGSGRRSGRRTMDALEPGECITNEYYVGGMSRFCGVEVFVDQRPSIVDNPEYAPYRECNLENNHVLVLRPIYMDISIDGN